jgi:hypothetical protein
MVARRRLTSNPRPADKNLVNAVRLRVAATSGALALFFSSALLATGAPGWVLAPATLVGIVVIWRYTGALDLLRADWAEAKRRDKRNRGED